MTETLTRLPTVSGHCLYRDHDRCRDGARVLCKCPCHREDAAA